MDNLDVLWILDLYLSSCTGLHLWASGFLMTGEEGDELVEGMAAEETFSVVVAVVFGRAFRIKASPFSSTCV